MKMNADKFLGHAELSPLVMAELARIVGQHRSATHSLIEHCSEAEASALALRQRLAEWAEIPIWVEKRTTQFGQGITVFLSDGEKECSERRFQAPYREGATHLLRCRRETRPSGTVEKTSLGGLLGSQEGIDAFFSRLNAKCVAPYEASDVDHLDLSQSQTVWAWDNGERYPTALLCLPMPDVANGPSGEFPVCIPAGWGKLDTYWYGWLSLHKGHTLVVSNSAGRYGLLRLKLADVEPVRVVGHWLQPCTWVYLSGGRGTCSAVIEVASSVEPDERGELVCDLLDPLDGHRINPPGVKGLLGSTGHEGTLVVNEAGHGRYPRVLGRLDRQGILYCGQAEQEGEIEPISWSLDDVRWLELGSQREGLTAVRSPENGLWGYVDRSGAVCIAPQFGDVWAFGYGTAVAQLAGREFYGLIDKTGQWVLQAEWLYLNRWSERILVVEDAEHRWGAINVLGEVIVAFLPFAAWMTHPEMVKRLEDYRVGRSWSDNPEAEKRQTLIETIVAIWKTEYRESIRQAFQACQGSLGGLEGLFDADTTQLDLIETGVWGREIRLLRDKTTGILQPSKGETGRIGCYYPVGLSIFELSIEAPVNGLQSQPEAAIGIPWRDLALVESHGEKLSEPVSSRWKNIKRGISTAGDISAYLVGFFMLFVRVGVVGICLDVILKRAHDVPYAHAIPGLLCMAYLAITMWKIVAGLTRGNYSRNVQVLVLAQAYQDSVRFFGWNFLGFATWVVFVLTFKNEVDGWFAFIWAFAATAGVTWLIKRILSVDSEQAEVPPWPVELVEEIKAKYRQELLADGGAPFSGVGTMGDVARVQMGLVDDYAERYPAVAYYEAQIHKVLNETRGV